MENQKKYDLVLIEKPYTEGLTRSEVLKLVELFNDGDEYYPIELEAHHVESSAMGFISQNYAEQLDYDYEESRLRDFVANIMDNMNNETPDHVYSFKGFKIWLDRL